MVKWRCGREDCPKCYSGRRGRAAYRGHYGYRNGRPFASEDNSMAFVRRPSESDNARAAGDGSGDPDFAGQYPALYEYLSLSEFPEGGRRETATLMVLMEDGLYKACLNDRANDRSAWVSGDTFDRVLIRLEAILATDTAEWRKRTGKPPQGQQKRR